jgi:hypothetical protein
LNKAPFGNECILNHYIIPYIKEKVKCEFERAIFDHRIIKVFEDSKETFFKKFL